MRRLMVCLLLLLPLPLYSEVKILIPVVVKDDSGKPVTDLNVSDFQVSGPKDISIDRMWLIPPQTVSGQDPKTPVVVVYDAANATNPSPDLRTKWVREFLGMVAQHRAPVTFYIDTADGLRLIYDPSTPPEILSAALTLTETPKATSTDPKVEEQAKALALLKTSSQIRTFRFDYSLNQMNSLIAVARVLQGSDKRKAVVWLTTDPAPRYRYPNAPMREVMVEQFNAAHVSLYPLYIAASDAFPSQTLQWLAEGTGGRTFKNGSIWEVVEGTLADFGPYYMLAVAIPEPHTLGWIPSKLKVKRPGVTVRTASGFVGLKPPKAQAAHP